MPRKVLPAALVSLLLVFTAFGVAYAADRSAAKPADEQDQMTAEKMKAVIEQALKTGQGQANAENQGTSAKVGAGDLVKVNYTVALETGEVVATTDVSVAHDAARSKVAWFKDPDEFAPEEVLGGRQGLFPGLGDAVIGLTSGERKTLTLPPERAYGVPDPAGRKAIPAVQTMPKTIRMSPDEYVQKFHAFPVVGKEVALTPYFGAIVMEAGEDFALLECLAKDGEHYQERFGVTEVKVDGGTVSMILNPRLGSPFDVKGQEGRIVAADGNTFTVDFNNPMAGKPVVLDLQVLSVTKASDLDAMRVDWVENHDEGLALAKQQGKPAVLVLYADWCAFCKKLFTESLQDPRVRALKDRFVWIKVNSDVNSGFKEKYGQNGFPLIVLLSPDGRVIHKIDGYKDALAFRKELIASTKAL